MPPKGRSSSSRSSSSRSRSSSRSSSSRSSSRSGSSRNRSSSSRPSSRSYSSSSYSSKSYNYGGSPNYNNRNEQIEKEISKKRKAKVFALNYKRPVRQVSSFIENNKKPSTTYHHCFKHDYYYFNEEFMDEFSGQTFKKGYYDEEGTYYEDLTLNFSKMETISMYTCEHCESSVKIDLITSPSNEALTCPNCGALINLNNIFALNIDYYVCDANDNFINEDLMKTNDEYSYNYNDNYSSYNNSNYYSSTYSRNKESSAFTLIKIFVFIFMCVNFLPAIIFLPMIGIMSNIDNNYNTNSSYEDNYNSSYNDYYDYNILGETIYVSAIDRHCYFDGDYYYDVTSDCYFCYNTEKDIPSMQFWYEDFSSNYGDYGWLEYDEVENTWYVEVGLNEWKKVENPPEYFWHTTFDQLLIDNEIPGYTTNNESTSIPAYEDYYDYSILGDNIYVSTIDRHCSFLDGFYYDETSNCYFCYNTEKDIPSMQYWFEGFSDDYEKYGDYGWLEYNETEKAWYVEVGLNEWEKVENPPEYFWHTTFDQLLTDNNKTIN